MAPQQSEFLYVLCNRMHEFREVQRMYSYMNCIYLHDGNSIRGRCRGDILRYGTYAEKWNYQEIEESIDIAERVWENEERKVNLETKTIEKEDGTESEGDLYGV